MFDAWKPDLLMAVPLALSMALYLRGLARVRAPRMEVCAFVAGWCVLVVSLLSPIATVSEVLFSMHMTQHELLMLVAAPLVTLGRPLVPMLWALPTRWRHSLKGGGGLSPAWSRLTSPAAVFMLHAAALWVWHLPPLYEAAVLDDRVHALQHLMFTGTACLFWWGLLRGRYGRLGYGAAVFYVFATAMHSGGLGALITFASAPIYPLYVHRAQHGVDPLVDQQLAGLIMWIPAGVVLTIFGLALLSAWLGESERRAKITTVLLLAMLCAPLSAGQREITIRTGNLEELADYGRGVRLGAAEAERAAMLLGHKLLLVTSGQATAIVVKQAPDAAPEGTPVVAMSGKGGGCVFVTESPEARRSAEAYIAAQRLTSATTIDWHPHFRRYGASELNERYEKTFGRPMSADAWHGWVAVKAIIEASLRGDNLCDALTRLRFDGHKGRALRFDAKTRTLIHPALLVRVDEGKEIVEVVP
jgi:putative membrane protein